MRSQPAAWWPSMVDCTSSTSQRLWGGCCSGKPLGEGWPFAEVAGQAATFGKGADSGLGFGGGSACDSSHGHEAELVGELGDEVSAAPAWRLGHEAASPSPKAQVVCRWADEEDSVVSSIYSGVSGCFVLGLKIAISP